MFNKNEIQQFRSEGWIAITEFWTEREVRAMRAELERLKAVGLLRNVATSSDKINLQLCPMFPHSRFYRAMPFADKAISAVRQLIGDPVVLQLDQVFLKPGGARHGHQLAPGQRLFPDRGSTQGHGDVDCRA